jgi:hypothetical protein
VGDDDAVEIPTQDGFDRVTGGAAVGNHASDQPMRAKPSSRAGQPMEQARLGGLFPSQVEDQVGKNQRVSRWKKTTSLRNGAPRKRCCSIWPCQSGWGQSPRIESNFRSARFFSQTWRTMKARVRIGFDVVSDE